MRWLIPTVVTAMAGGVTYALTSSNTLSLLKSGGSKASPQIGRDAGGNVLPEGSFPLRRGGKNKLIQVMQTALLGMREEVARYIETSGGADGKWGTGTSKALKAAGYSDSYITAEDFANITNASESIPEVDGVIFTPRGQYANLRSCPSVNDCPPTNVKKSTIIIAVPSGETMRFLGEKERESRAWGDQFTWYKVATQDGTQGWVRNDVVKVVSGTLSGGLDGLDCVTRCGCRYETDGGMVGVAPNRFIGQLIAEKDGSYLVRLNNTGKTAIIPKEFIRTS